MTQPSTLIGASLPNIDARDKVTGATHYTTDLVVDGMVWAYPVFSRIPFGKIIDLDISRAAAAEGYIDAIFAKDIPGANQVGLFLDDQPLLAQEIVRFIGDVIGIVVAESAEAACRIASLVDIEYEEFQPYLTIQDSESATDRFIHDSNIACSHQVLNGDWEAGFRQADVIVEADFSTHNQEHFYLEPQGCIVMPEENGHFTIIGSLQCPFYIQKAVARVMGTPLNKVRVIQAPTGGAFGGKEDVPSELSARAALAARIVNRPVKMVYQREDDVQLTSKRHPFQMHHKIGVSRTGKLLAADIEIKSNSGAYATLSSVVSYRSTMQAMGPYVVPDIRVRSMAYYTNLPPAGAFRGFGSPQAAFGHERMMDMVAERLGMDPIELRLKNVLHPGDMTITGQKLNVSVGAEETFLKARAASRWEAVRKGGKKSTRYLTGIGVGSCIYGNCLGAAGWPLDGSGVKVQIHRDGSFSVAYGLTEMGQGASTVVAQLAAEAFGVDPGRISVVATDTVNVPDSGPSVASRNVVMSGNALRDAASQIFPHLKTAAAELLDCEADDIIINNDTATNSTTGQNVGFTELAEQLFLTNRPMDAVGWWHVPPLEYDPEVGLGEAYFTYSYATHIAKVRVDRLTGLIQVEKVWAAHDVGKVINPAGLEGQVEGGVVQSTGWALTEQYHTEGGRVITDNFSTYLMPTICDVPEVETIPVEAPEPLGPWGAKGIGEPATIPTAAAIANAVSHALGVPVNDLPITPEKVLHLLSTAEAP
jgi:CO/xanthine dehydrogenase Mo-binding subunit